MRAALYVGHQTFRVEDRAVRDPGPGEVRIDVAVVGICGTDLHIKHGAMDGRVRTPTVIGHEMSGTVAAVGDGVDEFAPGDRVTVMPLDWCGDCAACRAGHRHVCQNLVFVGIDAVGAMQQSWTIPERWLVRLPEGLDLKAGALSEPAATEVEAAIGEWTDGAGADVAFEVSGSAAGLRTATHALRVRGRLVVVAIHNEPVPADLFRVFWRELSLIGARVYERRDFERAVEMLSSGQIPAAQLISAVLPLERTPEAFSQLESSEEAVKVLIDCRQTP